MTSKWQKISVFAKTHLSDRLDDLKIITAFHFSLVDFGNHNLLEIQGVLYPDDPGVFRLHIPDGFEGYIKNFPVCIIMDRNVRSFGIVSC